MGGSVGTSGLIAGEVVKVESIQEPDVYIKVLGVTQDAGFPQIGCEKDCCRPMWKPATPDQYVVSLGLIDKKNGAKWLVEATPDIKYQLALLNEDIPTKDMLPNGIFLTHAHIGHYSGLIQLGREAIGADNVLVHCMPRMANFLESNGPWSQLVTLENIKEMIFLQAARENKHRKEKAPAKIIIGNPARRPAARIEDGSK